MEKEIWNAVTAQPPGDESSSPFQLRAGRLSPGDLGFWMRFLVIFLFLKGVHMFLWCCFYGFDKLFCLSLCFWICFSNFYGTFPSFFPMASSKICLFFWFKAQKTATFWADVWAKVRELELSTSEAAMEAGWSAGFFGFG